MEELSTKTLFGSLIAIISYILGVAGSLFWIYVIVAAMDFVTGVTAAYINSELSSEIGRKGILKKFGTFCVIVISVLLDFIALEHGIGTQGLIYIVVASWYIATDMLSILENVGRCGVAVPEVLTKGIAALKALQKTNLKK